MTIRLYLKGGAVIEFQVAEGHKINWEHGNGKLTKIDFTGALGDVPLWVDLDEVVAITRRVDA